MPSTDPELGIASEEAFIAGEMLQPRIQAMIDDRLPPGAIITALAEAFFGSLKAAGASKWQIEKASNRLLKHLKSDGIPHTAVQDAYEYIGPEILNMTKADINPLSIAYALSGMISNFIPESKRDKFLKDMGFDHHWNENCHFKPM